MLHLDISIYAVDEARDRSTGTTSRLTCEMAELSKVKNRCLKLSTIYALIEELACALTRAGTLLSGSRALLLSEVNGTRNGTQNERG